MRNATHTHTQTHTLKKRFNAIYNEIKSISYIKVNFKRKTNTHTATATATTHTYIHTKHRKKDKILW